MGAVENISDTLPLARTSRRGYAALVDYGIFIVVMIWYIGAFGQPTPDGGHQVSGVRALPLLLFWMLYFPILEGWMGRTLGKELFSLQVVQPSGAGITFFHALKRRLLDGLDLNFFAIPALIAVRNTDGKQRLGDLWASTHVVRTPTVECPNCSEEVALEGKEIRTGQFRCPSCRESVSVQVEERNP
jgi:uncharacterized RDD family membrane protein YckC